MKDSPKQPHPFVPDTHKDMAIDIGTIAPTADQATLHLNTENNVAYSGNGHAWQLGVINSKPDVFIASDGHFQSIRNHYDREHRIYTLMKWILRVNRRDANRTTPLLMVDAGSNHGLFSMVAGVSGAHAIAFEPQTHLRSVINFGARANEISDRLRILPFAVLDGYKQLGMSNFEKDDGGIGSLDYKNTGSAVSTQTIRLDAIPSYDLLFTYFEGRHPQKSLIYPADLGSEYADALKKGLADQQKGVNTAKVMPEHLSLRTPIHFLKIDVEGFELHALESAQKLFEQELVQHAVLEFGAPDRWDVTFEEDISVDEKRKRSNAQCKRILNKMVNEYGFDAYVLPSIGWKNTVDFLTRRGVDFGKPATPDGNRIVHKLKAYDFDAKPMEDDEFELELSVKDQLITEYVPMPASELNDYIDALDRIGEVYLWFAKRDSAQVKTILARGGL
ncbi:hypothetical protein BC940DRAFT_57031 [Gongronella butleri]|nr:hypothetical protein BC940DRAFT_57031 [Gongronella butleri]